MTTVSQIARFMLDSFLTTWHYLLITIPLAVAVNLSGASRYVSRAFRARPLVAIVLATAVGAFSPFCSCGVIPVIAALLIGGVPLAPVMSFWIASPSMDPEIFFLSVATLGTELAVWRLAGILALSLAAGLVTHLLTTRGWLAGDFLRPHHRTEARTLRELARDAAARVRAAVHAPFGLAPAPQVALCCATTAPISAPTAVVVPMAAPQPASAGCASGACAVGRPSFQRRLWDETRAATWMVVRFMALAFFLEALITLFVPESLILGLLGANNPWAIVTAALLGVPLYTSNLTALPLVSGLLAKGMDPAAALAFLVAGPMTTLPAMAAVWGLVRRRVFALYVLTALVGALVLGYALASVHVLSAG